MTYLIPLTSTKHDRAIRFGHELERAMKKRGVGTRTIAEPLHASRTSVMYWRTGRMLPRIDTARRLAEVLDWPRLASLALELRQKACTVCGTVFADDSGSDNRVYCTPSCQRVKEKGRVGVDRRARAATAERKLILASRAIAAYCSTCEPEGRCYAAECELRPVSPLPLFEERSAITPALPRPRNGYRTPGADSARQARVWARYSPQEAAERKERAAQASRIARGLVPAEARA